MNIKSVTIPNILQIRNQVVKVKFESIPFCVSVRIKGISSLSIHQRIIPFRNGSAYLVFGYAVGRKKPLKKHKNLEATLGCFTTNVKT